MTKQERTEIKKKARRRYLIGYGMAGFAILFIVLVFATPVVEPFRKLLASENIIHTIVGVCVMVLFSIVPMFGSLIVVSSGSWTIQELYDYKRKIHDSRNKFHLKLFWNAIQEKDYEKAKKLYNCDKFITGSERVLCNGILMGIATEKPIDEEWKEKVGDRMNSYFI